MNYTNLTIIVFSLLFSGCSGKIIEGRKLSKNTIKYIQELGILNEEEKILYYYTSFNDKVSGNFVTEKRVASYWLYEDNDIKSAYYNEIKSINIKYGDGFEFTSALVIELNDGAKFDVYFNDTKEEIDKLYKEVIQLWKK